MERIRQVTPHLEVLGATTTVACLDAPWEPWLDSFPCATVALGPVVSTFGYRRGLPQCIRTLAQSHDVVVVHGIWNYHAFATWRALHGTGIPYYVYTHGMLDPWFRRNYPIKHLKKWAYWPWADYRVLRDATAVLFTSEQERMLARQSFWLYSAREKVVNYGTSIPEGHPDEQRSMFLEQYSHLHGKRILLFLSRIHPKKGLDLLIEAFASIAAADCHLHLVIAGPDQTGWQARLQQRVAALGLDDRVSWLGMLSGSLKWGAFRSAELFCLPSHQENFGIVVAEALACGLPVMLAKPVNISREVAEAGAGLVHPDTILGTSAALCQWLTLSPAERTAMGDRASNLFLERFHSASSASSELEAFSLHSPTAI